MNKFKKLLSVLLAVVMAFSCFAVLGYAYQDYEDPDAYFYDSNDNPRAYLYTDEQRASFIVDLVDGILEGANIKKTVVGQKVDLTSLDATMDTLDRLLGIIKAAGILFDFGILEKLNTNSVDTTLTTTANGCVTMLNTLLNILRDNADMIANDIIAVGKINLGNLISLGDMSAIEDILGDLPEFLGGIVYGLGARKITNGIGNDPKYPNSAVWDEWDANENGAKPNLDTMVQNLLFKLLTEPNNTEPTNDPTRNDIITNPEDFGATADMIHQDENGYYYIYGTEKNGEWKFTEKSTTVDESDKHDILQWKDDSSLVDGVAGKQLKDIINLTNGDLYTMLEKAIPWAYDTFAGHNLDGQLRATLMQFCGAFNNGDVDDATKEELTAIVNSYKEKEDKADKDKSVLRNEFAATQGVAGNYNFMYIDLEGKAIGDKTSDSLYYVVEWGNSWQYYHVELGENGKNVNELFDLIDWEYQAPMWSTVASAAGIEAGKSFLLHINDIVGTILKTAMPSLSWTAGTADNTLRDNLLALMKLVIHKAKAEIWGELYELPENFDNFNFEEALVLIASELLELLMPQLILPADVSSVEEIGAYALREFMAEVLPHLGAGWDEMIAEAKALTGTAREDAFLNIALNMGVSVGAYYLQNLIGLGTVTDGKNNTSVETVPMGAGHEWKEILNYIIDWVIKCWVPGITTNVAKKYPDAMNGSDPLLKLSAIFSTIAPTLVKTLGAADETKVGNNTLPYYINLNHVYDDLRLAFNGNFSELAKGLMRKSSGTSANMEAMQALATLIKELFGGLGFDNVGTDWTKLSGLLDTAATAEYPLTKLVGEYDKKNDALVKLIAPFLRALTDTRAVWLKPMLTIILSFAGGLTSTLKANGIDIQGVKSAYTGSDKFTIEYSFELLTNGVKTYFNNGRYKTTAGALASQKTGFDGDYAIKFYDAKVVDENGNEKGFADFDENITFGPNEVIPGKINFSGVTEKIETYTLETRYQIISPDGTAGTIQTDKRSFIVTKTQNDALSKVHVNTPTDFTNDSKWVSTLSGCGDSAVKQQFFGNWVLNYNNIYISEKENLAKVETPIFSMTDNSREEVSNGDKQFTPLHSYTKVWVWEYGYNIPNEDGSISVNTAEDGTGSQPAEKIKVSGAASSLFDNWFKWAGNDGDKLNSNSFLTVTPAGYTTFDKTSDEYPLWVAETKYTREYFEGDFYSYALTVPLSLHTNMGGKDGVIDNDDTMTVKDFFSFTTYVTLYNSYDLQSKLDAAISVDKENYDTTSAEWKELTEAIEYAKLQMYGAWEASKFVGSHTANIASLPTGIPKDEDGENYEGYTSATVSTFKYAADRLDVALREIANVYVESDTESSAVVMTPSNPDSDLYEIYNALKEIDEEGYKNQNYALYRWFKFSDKREAIRTALNAATPPSGVAYNTLAGVAYDKDGYALDNAGIDAVVNTLTDADVKAIVASLVETPTKEAIDAAAKALADFVMPEYDKASLSMMVQDMGTAEKRLLPKYDAQQKYFLNKSIADFGNEVATNYTAESYALYKDALDVANATNASATATQYEIFSARYELQYAYNKLILVDEAVNMEALKNAVLSAQTILDAIGTEDEYTLADDATVESLEEAYKALVLAMGIVTTYEDSKYYIGGNFSGEYALAQEGLITANEQQPWVDSVAANVEAAVANFKSAAASEPNTLTLNENAPFEAIIDTVNCGDYNGVVYGFDTLGWNDNWEVDGTIADFLSTAYGDDYLEVIEADGGETTGALINVLDENGEVVETYVYIYFGDVDGDGNVGEADAAMAADYELLYEGFDTLYQFMAADIDADSMPGESDAGVMADWELLYEGMPTQAEIAEMVVENVYEIY